MKLATRVIGLTLLGLSTGLLSGCGSDPSCAAGTILVGDECVAVVRLCAGGTVLNEASGVCVPVCPATHYWDGVTCQPEPTCGEGTTVGSDGCVPACAAGYVWSENACIADCRAGTVLDPASGTCVLDPTACGEGSHFEDGICVADVVCGPGTHAEGGVCVPGLPDPDVLESADPELAAPFDLPAAGESVVLGGSLSPEDTARPLPGDRFVVTAPEGSWLRLTATGAGGLRPALRIVSTEPDLDGGQGYERLAYEAGTLEVTREVYLPVSGDYEILVTTQDELIAFIFGGGSLPVGGPDLEYAVEVENLGTPVPVVVDELPTAATGALDDGALGFYQVTSAPSGGVLGISSGAAGLPDEPGDFYPAVLAFSDTGSFAHGRVSPTTYEQAEVLVAQGAGESTLVVQDFFLALGPLRDYRLALSDVTPVDCDSVSCSALDLPEGGEALLRWNLDPGDLFLVGAYAPSANGVIRSSLHDANLEITAEEQWFDAMSVGAGRAYATEPTSVSLWLREYTRMATAGVETIAQIEATHRLENDQSYAGRGLVESPPYTYGRFGIDHVVAQAGQLLFFPGFATHDGSTAWSLPEEALLTSRFETVGPILDPSSMLFPDYGLTPLIGYARESTHYLHLVWDGYGDPVGGTYDVGFSTLDTIDLGAPTSGNPVSAASQVLGGLKAYRFTSEQAQALTITVTPSLISTGFQPEVWVMSFGAPAFDFIWYVWQPDPDALQLGVEAHEIAPDGGEPVSIAYPAPYAGLTVLMVENASSSSVNVFSIEVSAD